MKNVSGKVGAAVGAMALAVSFVGGWEGLSLVAYRDIGNVPTVCYGETRGVKMGDKYTKAECDAMLEKALIQFESGLDRCMATPTPLPVKTKVALVSWSYNVGIGAACKSTLVRLANQGEYTSACNQLSRWNRDNGKVINGLTKRRESERRLCLDGLAGDRPIPKPEPRRPDATVVVPPRKC